MADEMVFLARICSLPASAWLALGSPQVFAFATLDLRLSNQLMERGQVLAEILGQHLVPWAGLERDQRRRVLTIRRRLHGLNWLDDLDLQFLDTLATQLTESFVATTLSSFQDARRACADIAGEFERVCEIEALRTRTAPLKTLLGAPAGRAVLACADPKTVSRLVCRGLGEEEHNHAVLERDRRYAHALLARASVIPTPRSVFSAWVWSLIQGSASDSGLDPELLGLQPGWSLLVTENLRTSQLKNDSAWYVNPLLMQDGEKVHLWHQPDGDTFEHKVVTVRPFLLQILKEAEHPISTAELCRSLSDSLGYDAVATSKLIAEAAKIGILRRDGHAVPVTVAVTETSRASSNVATAVNSIRQFHVGEEATSLAAAVYIDSLRRMQVGEGLDSVAACVHRTVTTMMQRSACFKRNRSSLESLSRIGDGETVPLLTLLAQESADLQSAPLRGTYLDEAAAATALRSLADWAADSEGRQEVRFEDAPLSVDGTIDLDWPRDVLFRPFAAGSGQLGVVGDIYPCGVIDARIAASKFGRDPTNRRENRYWQFLKEVERRTGRPHVEFLSPPGGSAAANAVRRPLYTQYVTGDVNVASYGDPIQGGPPEYIQLREIGVKRHSGRLALVHGGRELMVLRHATRRLARPWSDLYTLIILTSPISRSHLDARNAVDEALKGLARAPRVISRDAVVVRCRTWTLQKTSLPTVTGSIVTQVRELVRFSRDWGLPRHVMLKADSRRPVPCDLESLTALHSLKRFALSPGSTVRIQEMLPQPMGAFFDENGEGHLGELVLRLPHEDDYGNLVDAAVSNFV